MPSKSTVTIELLLLFVFWRLSSSIPIINQKHKQVNETAVVSQQQKSLDNGSADSLTSISPLVGENETRLCACPKHKSHNGSSHKRISESERRRLIGREARMASTSLSFLLILIVGSVFCSKMWRQNQFLPEADNCNENKHITLIKASEVLYKLKNLRRKFTKHIRPRSKRKKWRTERVPLIPGGATAWSDNETFSA